MTAASRNGPSEGARMYSFRKKPIITGAIGIAG